MREQASARSGFFPWCSTALAALFVAASLWAAGAAPPLLGEAEKQLAAAETWWQKRPYLYAGPLLEYRLGAERISREREQYDALHRGNGTPAPGQLRRDREGLDELVAKAGATLANLPAQRFGVDPIAWRPETLLTHVPIHASVAHLLGNVVLLLFLGLYLESGWGRARFLGIAALAAIGAAAGYAIGAPDSARPFVGSSGMLAGLLLVFGLHYIRARSDGFYWVGLVLGSLWLLLPPLMGWQWSLDAPGAALLGGTLPPLAIYSAFAGGGLCAFAGYQLLRLTGLRTFSWDGDEKVDEPSALNAARIARLRAMGRLEDAFVHANAWARREPDSLDAALTLCEAAQALDRPQPARAALLKAVRLEVKAGLLAAALEHWRQLSASGVPREAEPALLIRIATLLQEADDRIGAAKALRAAVESAGDANRAVVAGRVARAARDIDMRVAHDAAWRALQRPEIDLEERQALEELLGDVIRRMPRELEAALEARPASRDSESRAAIPIDIETRVRVLDAVDALPLELDDEGIHFATASGQKRLMRYDRIQAVSVAAIQGLSDKPVLIVDLVLDWKASAGDRLRVIRMRADRFDPRRVVPGIESPLEALRQMIATVLGRSKGVPLPDPDAARGMPFASFPELALYQRLVLLAEGPAQPPAQPKPAALPKGASAADELPEPEIEEPAPLPPQFWEFKA